MRMMSIPFHTSPRAAFALRDWYRSTFSAPLLPDADGNGRFLSGIIPPEGIVKFLAEATRSADPGWPFTGVVELLTQPSPAGIYGFHGRIRLPSDAEGNGRRLNGRATCRLTIRVRGYVPHVIEAFDLPGDGEPVNAPGLINLFPAADYPFPVDSRKPTLLEAVVRQADGGGLADVRVTPLDGRLRSTRTGADGRFLLVLDYVDERDGVKPVDSPLKLTLVEPGGASVTYDRLEFQKNQRNRPATILKGKLIRNGAPLAGAQIAVRLEAGDQPFRVTTRSDEQGAWELRADDRLPMQSEEGAKLFVTWNSQRFENDVMVDFGTTNDVGEITIPTG